MTVKRCGCGCDDNWSVVDDTENVIIGGLEDEGLALSIASYLEDEMSGRFDPAF